MPNSGCHCGIAEGACVRDFPNATWSYLCHECLETDFDDSDPQVPKTDEEKNSSLTVPAIIIATAIVVVGCMISITIAIVWSRRAGKRSNANSGMPAGTMVVGYPADSIDAAV